MFTLNFIPSNIVKSINPCRKVTEYKLSEDTCRRLRQLGLRSDSSGGTRSKSLPKGEVEYGGVEIDMIKFFGSSGMISNFISPLFPYSQPMGFVQSLVSGRGLFVLYPSLPGDLVTINIVVKISLVLSGALLLHVLLSALMPTY